MRIILYTRISRDVKLIAAIKVGLIKSTSKPRVNKLDVPLFDPKLGLIKPGQTYVCPQLWAFSYENITLAYFVSLTALPLHLTTL